PLDRAETVAPALNMIDLARSQLLCSCISTRRIDVAIAVPARVVGRVEFRLLREGMAVGTGPGDRNKGAAPRNKRRKKKEKPQGNVEGFNAEKGVWVIAPPAG